MNVQPRAQHASPGEGKAHAARCLPAGGAVCRVQGVNRRPGSEPDCLAGKGGWRCPQALAAGDAHGSLDSFPGQSVPPGSRRDSWAFRLGSGAHESPDVAQGFRNSGSKAGGKGGGFYHQRCSYLHRQVREKRKAEPHSPGGHRNRCGGTLS